MQPKTVKALLASLLMLASTGLLVAPSALSIPKREAGAAGAGEESVFLDAKGKPDEVDSTCCDWDSGAKEISGDLYPHTIYYEDMCWGDEEWIDYNLGRDWVTFRATAGLLDDSDSGTRFILEIYGDEQLMEQQTVNFGEGYPLEIDVTGVLRLRLSVTTPDDPDSCDISPAFGSALVSRPTPALHKRTIEISRSKKKIVGSVIVSDGYPQCASNVTMTLQSHSSFYGWSKTRKKTTDAAGSFAFRFPRYSIKGEKFRVVTKSVDFGELYPEHRCVAATSNVIRK